jgi:tetratricopeptide (TPR) repeat protein
MIGIVRCWQKFSLCIALALITFLVCATDNPPTEAVAVDTERIAKLIERLGSDDFGAREKAQSELAQAGLEAYDALHAAQSHPDPEIALRARYLVRSMSVRWFADNDSPRVVAILRDYGDLQDADRRSRIDRLKALDDRAGVGPLIRLARFESHDPTAKYAALQIIDLGPPSTQAEKIALNKSIDSIIGVSKRPSGVWLKLYGKTLLDPAQMLADWERAVQAEQSVFEKNQEHSSREIVRDLYRYQVDLLQSLDRDEEVSAVIRRMFALQDGSVEQLQEMADWLIYRKSWPLALELMQKFDSVVNDNPRLLYRRAAVHLNLKDEKQAEVTAAQALAIRPENVSDHLVIGHDLEEIPLLATWAEGEYRQVIANAMLPSRPDFAARYALSELLHDRLKELPAAEILQPICDLIKKDENARSIVEQTSRTTEEVSSRMNFFYACHFHEQGEWVKEKEHLRLANNGNPKDADVLIAMYRLPEADAAWKAMSQEKLQAAISEFYSEVQRTKAEVDSADGEESRRSIQPAYAEDCNQYAWLVGNTFGDHQEAVRLSEESVRICRQLPEMKKHLAGFLDTLGRAYYGAGDLASAVKHQAMAVELNPVSGQIRRQLELFKKEAKDKGIAVPDTKSQSAAK